MGDLKQPQQDINHSQLAELRALKAENARLRSEKEEKEALRLDPFHLTIPDGEKAAYKQARSALKHHLRRCKLLAKLTEADMGMLPQKKTVAGRPSDKGVKRKVTKLDNDFYHLWTKKCKTLSSDTESLLDSLKELAAHRHHTASTAHKAAIKHRQAELVEEAKVNLAEAKAQVPTVVNALVASDRGSQLAASLRLMRGREEEDGDDEPHSHTQLKPFNRWTR